MTEKPRSLDCIQLTIYLNLVIFQACDMTMLIVEVLRCLDGWHPAKVGLAAGNGDADATVRIPQLTWFGKESQR